MNLGEITRRVELQTHLSGINSPTPRQVVNATLEVLASELSTEEQFELLTRTRARIRRATEAARAAEASREH